ncbi:MAG: hypothetical protein ACI9MS_001091, partial [Glaciecola sp.]
FALAGDSTITSDLPIYGKNLMKYSDLFIKSV